MIQLHATDQFPHLLGLRRGNEVYVVRFDDATTAADVVHAIGDWTNNSDLAFTWYDVAVLAQRLDRSQDQLCRGA